MPDILQRALDPCAAPRGILFGHPDDEMLDLLEHAPTTRPAKVCPLARDQLSVPPENRVGCDDRRDLTEPATAYPVSMHGKPTAFFIGEADPATEARPEDAVSLNRYATVACRSSAQPATAITKSRTAVTSTTIGVYLTR